MQYLISIDLNTTFYFSNFKDGYYDDGYAISFHKKILIDSCLKYFPEMLFLRDLPESSQEDKIIEAQNRTNSVLKYAYTKYVSHHGFLVRINFYSLTSVIAYLLEQGAGIGCGTIPESFELNRISPQLLVGASDNDMKYRSGANQHIFKYMDIISLYRTQHLSDNDTARLTLQATNGLRYGNFNDKIKLELIKINRLLGVINQFNDKQLSAFVEYNTELLIAFLQAFHQQPSDVICHILTFLTDLNMYELTDMSQKIIAKHERDFPGFRMGR